MNVCSLNSNTGFITDNNMTSVVFDKPFTPLLQFQWKFQTHVKF